MRYIHLIALLPLALFSDQSADVSPPPAIEQTKEEVKPAAPLPHHMRITVRHIEAGGIGYDDGYTTLEGFFALDPARFTNIGFLDVRGHVFDDGRFAANAGLGWRTSYDHRVYGLNVYYDYRQTKHAHYNQIGAGLETLGEIVDFRVNGYFPVGNRVSHPYAPEFFAFEGNRLIVSQKFEFSQFGVHPEVGFHCGTFKDWDIYAAAGPYYFGGKFGQNAWGGQARLGASYKEYVTLEITNSYDSVFHENFQGQIGFTIPFGSRSETKKSCCNENPRMVTKRLVQPVPREEIIVVGRERKQTVAIDPATGLPFNFLFVDNLSHSAGTFESPYNTLATAEGASNPYDIIYVFPGDGTTTGMDAGITLLNNQQLLGSGMPHVMQTEQGTITIPPFSSTSPQITTGGSDIVTLANHNVVSGLTLVATGSINGITGTSITGLISANNAIQGSDNTGSGIVLSDSLGTISISNNNINEKLNPLVVSGATSDTIYNINNNTLTGLSSITLTGGSGTLITLFANNITGHPVGYSSDSFLISLTGTTGSSITVQENLLNATESGFPFHLIFDNTTGSVLIAQNTVTGGTFEIGSFYDTNTIDISVIGNSFTDPGDACIHSRIDNSALLTYHFSDNTFSGGTYGIHMPNFSSSDVNTTIEYNTFINQSTGSVNVSNQGGGTHKPSIHNNQFTGSHVPATVVCTSSTLCLQFFNNSISSGLAPSQFTEAGGTFNLEPLLSNTGTITNSGTITNIPTGACQ